MVILQEAFLAVCYQGCAQEVLGALGATPGQQPELAGGPAASSSSAGAFQRAGTLGLEWLRVDLEEATLPRDVE